ncbi:MAG: adenylate/guanylate cyclase domain-containing protein [Actinomycetota bacterium]
MMQARLFELGIIGLNALIIVLAWTVGVQVSIWLGLLVLGLMAFGFMFLIYNFDYWLVRRLTTADDAFMLNLCQSGFIGRLRRMIGRLPANPRCRFCLVPFGGIGKLIRIKPSAKNPNYCRSCFEALPTKSHESEVGVLFADIRGFTPWTERHSPGEAADALTRFYATANRVLTADDALVDFVGDQVMALYPTVMPTLGDRTAEVMLAGARRLVAMIRQEDDALPVGVGLNLGVCHVGTPKVRPRTSRRLAMSSTRQHASRAVPRSMRLCFPRLSIPLRLNQRLMHSPLR